MCAFVWDQKSLSFFLKFPYVDVIDVRFLVAKDKEGWCPCCSDLQCVFLKLLKLSELSLKSSKLERSYFCFRYTLTFE